MKIIESKHFVIEFFHLLFMKKVEISFFLGVNVVQASSLKKPINNDTM